MNTLDALNYQFRQFKNFQNIGVETLILHNVPSPAFSPWKFPPILRPCACRLPCSTSPRYNRDCTPKTLSFPIFFSLTHQNITTENGRASCSHMWSLPPILMLRSPAAHSIPCCASYGTQTTFNVALTTASTTILIIIGDAGYP